MSAAPITGATGVATIAPARLTQIKKTAQQFEAIFVRQMLAAAHKSSLDDTAPDGPGTSSQATDTFTEMQDARFADIASQKGSFGLGTMIAKQLIRRETQSGGTAAIPTALPAVPATKGA